ncbi:SSI family serine proteinase inhibitor [Streptomyces sp. NPDC006879]|uniref:SSI family serine proteinase inhibitor n=1 Tax=Streptomyces sp. NPDC006879 TaxID=3364767 RepID=UPI00369A01FE
MRSITRGLGLTATAMSLVALTALSGAGAAGAAPSGTESLYAPSALVLSITAGDDTQQGTVMRAVTLNCAPGTNAQGTHPDPAGACAELRANDAELDAVTSGGSQAMCTKEWNPITVTAVGVWEGRRYDYAHTFANPCAKLHGSGSVFNF